MIQDGPFHFIAGDVLMYTSGSVFFVNVDPGVGMANAYNPGDNPCGIVAGLVGDDGWELEVLPNEISVIGFQCPP